MDSKASLQSSDKMDLGKEMAGKFLGQQFYDRIVSNMVSGRPNGICPRTQNYQKIYIRKDV